jgi:hypothetical protein
MAAGVRSTWVITMRDGRQFSGKSLSELSLAAGAPYHQLRFYLAGEPRKPEWNFDRIDRYDASTGERLPSELPRASKRERVTDEAATSDHTAVPPSFSRTATISTFGLFSTNLTVVELEAKQARVLELKALLIEATKRAHQIHDTINSPLTEDEFLHCDTFHERACFYRAREQMADLSPIYARFVTMFETVIICRDLLHDRDFEMLAPRAYWVQLSSLTMRTLLSRIAVPTSDDVANFFWARVCEKSSELPHLSQLNDLVLSAHRKLAL